MWSGWTAGGLGLLAGSAAAVALYASMSTPPPRSNAADTMTVPAPVPLATVYAPCVPPAQLEDGACVVHLTVVRTVPAASSPPSDATPTTSPSATTSP